MGDTREFGGFAFPDGRSTLDFPAQWKSYVKYLAGPEGNEITITAHRRRAKRSLKQSAYWWAVVVPTIAEHCGYTRDEMHEALKAKFLGTEDMSRGLLRIGSTRKLNTQEFTDLTDRVILWAAEDLGVVIPQPERNEKKRRKAA